MTKKQEDYIIFRLLVDKMYKNKSKGGKVSYIFKNKLVHGGCSIKVGFYQYDKELIEILRTLTNGKRMLSWQLFHFDNPVKGRVQRKSLKLSEEGESKLKELEVLIALNR